MRMVRVRHVGMRMALGLMLVRVAVFAGWLGVVAVRVVPVVVAVGMFVRQDFVRVFVAV